MNGFASSCRSPRLGFGHGLRRVFDRRAHAGVGATAAQVATHGCVDFRVTGTGVFGQERGSTHQLARLSIATLRHFVFDPRLLQGVAVVSRQPFDGVDFLARNAIDTGLT